MRTMTSPAEVIPTWTIGDRLAKARRHAVLPDVLIGHPGPTGTKHGAQVAEL